MSKTIKRRKRIWDDEDGHKPRNAKRRVLESKIRRPKTRAKQILEQYRLDDENDESIYYR